MWIQALAPTVLLSFVAPVLRAAMVELSRNQNYRERMKFFSIALVFSMPRSQIRKLPFARYVASL
jgi:hypothetical protein